MVKRGTTKLYHILPWYLRTEAICLGVVVVQLATESTLPHEPQVRLWWLGITSKSPAFETWRHLKHGCIQKMLQQPLLMRASR